MVVYIKLLYMQQNKNHIQIMNNYVYSLKYKASLGVEVKNQQTKYILIPHNRICTKLAYFIIFKGLEWICIHLTTASQKPGTMNLSNLEVIITDLHSSVSKGSKKYSMHDIQKIKLKCFIILIFLLVLFVSLLY